MAQIQITVSIPCEHGELERHKVWDDHGFGSGYVLDCFGGKVLDVHPDVYETVPIDDVVIFDDENIATIRPRDLFKKYAK